MSKNDTKNSNSNSNSNEPKVKKYIVIGGYIRKKLLEIGSEIDLTDEEAKELLALKPPVIKLKTS